MKTLLIALLALLSLSGCATVSDTLGDKRTLAVCKTADVVTTVAALNTGSFHELNPVMNALMGGAHGFMPFVLVSAAYVGIVWWLDNPKVTMVSSGITCGVAARNGYLLLEGLR